jgi:hypothetical protein
MNKTESPILQAWLETPVSNGWGETSRPWEYQKCEWLLFFDTSRWMELRTANNPRNKSLEVPDSHTDFQATLGEIERLLRKS